MKMFWEKDFDIDKYINPYIPAPRLNRLPYPIARFLGYRPPGKQQHDYTTTILLWAFVSEFASIAITMNILKRLDRDMYHLEIPAALPAFGAAGVLLFNSIDSPLGQPREFFLSHTLSATVGVGITKLFAMSDRFKELDWLCAAVVTSTASVVMTITGTIHPPAGATALVSTIDERVRRLGWYYLPLVLLNSAIFLVLALLLNNIQRRYPLYWWTPKQLGKTSRGQGSEWDRRLLNGQDMGGEEKSAEYPSGPAGEKVDAHGLRVPKWIMERLGDQPEDKRIIQFITELQKRVIMGSKPPKPESESRKQSFDQESASTEHQERSHSRRRAATL